MTGKYRAFLTPRATTDGMVEIPPESVAFSWTLDNTGTATVGPLVSTYRTITPPYSFQLDSWSRELLLLRDSGPGMLGPVFWGPVKAPTGDADTKKATVNAVDPAAWFTRRGWYTDNDFSAQDSADTARQMILAKTTGLGPVGDLGFVLTDQKSGMTGANVFKAADRARLNTCVDQCGNVGEGFDWAVLPGVDQAGDYIRTWVIYPGGRGNLVDRTLRKAEGGLRGFARSPAGEGVATRVYHPLTSTAGVTTYGYAQADDSTEQVYGIHEYDDQQGNAPGNDVNAAAAATLGYRSPPVQIISFSYRVSDWLPLGLVMPGDSVPVDVVGTGWPDYTGTIRVIGIAVTVDDNGQETVQCSAQAPPGGIS